MLDFAVMLGILVNCKSLQHVDASFTGLHGQGESKLHDALARATSLKYLSFSGVSFGNLQVSFFVVPLDSSN
jgi:Ran GTPase-activating protein (RanGAP) involved in mRNA processing and transport